MIVQLLANKKNTPPKFKSSWGGKVRYPKSGTEGPDSGRLGIRDKHSKPRGYGLWESAARIASASRLESPMVPAVPNQDLGNSLQSPKLSAIELKGRKAIYYQLDSAMLYKEMKLLNQVGNAVEGYELFPRPWFKTVGTILTFWLLKCFGFFQITFPAVFP